MLSGGKNGNNMIDRPLLVLLLLLLLLVDKIGMPSDSCANVCQQKSLLAIWYAAVSARARDQVDTIFR